MATKELTEGNPLKLIILFMLPMFFGNLFQQLYHLADALIVGRVIGLKSLAAIGATTPMIFLVISFIFASTQGFTVVTAQRFGARDYLGVKNSVCTSFVLSGVIMLALTAISTPFTHQMLVLLRTPNDILPEAETYLFIMFIGIFATVFYNLASNIIRALGDSKTPLYFLIFASLLNVALDLIFILKCGMKIEGAAWATVISQGVSTVLCLVYMFLKFPILRLKKENWKLNTDFVYEHLRVGIPMGFQMSVLTIGIIAVQYVLNGLGTTAIAAFTTAMRVDQLVTQSLLALGAAAATYTAQNFGARKISRIRKGARASIIIVLILSVLCVLLLYFFGKPIVSLFMEKPDSEVLRLAMQYLNVVMIFFFFLGCLLVYRNILQGMGNATVPLLSGIAELIMRVIAALYLGETLGYLGICLAGPAAWFSAAIVLYVGYKIKIADMKKRKYRY